MMINEIWTGVKRNPKKFGVIYYSILTTIGTIVGVIGIFTNSKITEWSHYYLAAYFVIPIIISSICMRPKKKVQFDLKNTNTKVEIVFGDLFITSGHKVIAANEFFDSEIGKPVSPKSIHGIFIKKILGGHCEVFDQAVTQQLNGKEIYTTNNKEGKKTQYKIGTTITIKHDNSTYFIFALTHSDNNCTATCTPMQMLTALEGLWNKIREEGNGIDINLPLIGNGLSRIGFPPCQLLQLSLISLLKAVKEKDLSSIIRFVLTPDMYDKIDLEIIKKNWQ